MEEESLIAQIVIYNAMNNANVDAGSFPITKEIRQSCKKAHQRKKLAQKSKKGDVQKSERERKRKLKEMKREKLDVEQTTGTLKKNLCEEATVSTQQNGRDQGCIFC